MNARKLTASKIGAIVCLVCLAILMGLTLAGCSPDPVPQPVPTATPAVAPIGTQQPVQVVAAPAPAPVVVQAAPQSSGAGDMLMGAAVGAMAMNAINNNDRDRYYDNRRAAPVQHKTVIVNKTYVNKTKVVNRPAARPASRPSPGRVSLSKRR